MKGMSIVLSLLLYSVMLYGASIEAIYVNTPPKIDGKVDDAIWKQAAVVSEFIQPKRNCYEQRLGRHLARSFYYS